MQGVTNIILKFEERMMRSLNTTGGEGKGERGEHFLGEMMSH